MSSQGHKGKTLPATLLLALLATTLGLVSGCDDESARPDRDAGVGVDATLPDTHPGAADVADIGTTPADAALTGDTSAGAIMCGGAVCTAATLQSLVDLPACCTAAAACGLDLRPAATLIPIPAACTAPGQPGLASAECPSFASPSTLFAGDTLQGCCRPDHTCGVFVRVGALDLGCTAAVDYVRDAGVAARCDVDAGTDAP